MNASIAPTRSDSASAKERPRRWPIFRPLLALLIFTVVFRHTKADLIVSSWFYDSANGEWPYLNATPCVWLYYGGLYPACALFVGSMIELALGWLRQRPVHLRAGAFLTLAFIIGPGLIVNYGLKGHWGRPRPNQVREFGGDFAFAPVGSPGTLQRHNSSFPSGHAAVAFYLLAPAFSIRPRRLRLARGMMIAGLAFGAVMSVVRVIQGGHFLSDVVWSVAIVYTVSWGLERLIFRNRYRASEPATLPAPEARACAA